MVTFNQENPSGLQMWEMRKMTNQKGFEMSDITVCVGITHPDFVEGYIDGRDLTAPEPNENRTERYKHSFRIGRAEARGLPVPSYEQSMKSAAKADEVENTR